MLGSSIGIAYEPTGPSVHPWSFKVLESESWSMGSVGTSSDSRSQLKTAQVVRFVLKDARNLECCCIIFVISTVVLCISGCWIETCMNTSQDRNRNTAWITARPETAPDVGLEFLLPGLDLKGLRGFGLMVHLISWVVGERRQVGLSDCNLR